MSSVQTVRFAAFDLDGTLLDSAGSIVEGVLACWEACGFAIPEPEAIRRIIGLPWEESVIALLPGAGPREFEQIRAYHEDVRQGLRGSPARREALFPGVRETLRALEAESYVLGIVTSRSGGRLSELLQAHEIGHHFAVIKTADMGPGKPNPYLLLEAMADVGADASATVMIGDTTFDIEMAVGAGTGAVGVSWGVHEVSALQAAGAHRIVTSFDEVQASVNAITDRG